MLTKEQLNQVEDQGFTILEQFFTEEEMDELKMHIDKWVLEDEKSLLQSGGRNGISRAKEINFTSHLVKKDPYFIDFCAQPRFVELTTALIGPDVNLYHEQAVYKHPEGEKEFPWHQDNGYGQIISEQYITCWIALEDATLENGCIWVLPGSHKRGLVEHAKTPLGWQCYDGDEGIPVPVNKGSMIVFSSLLFHRSGPNVSSAMRKAYITQYSSYHAVNAKTGNPFRKIRITKDGGSFVDTSNLDYQDKAEGRVSL